jgi:alpha-1,2-mannosyltransferase
MSTLMSSTSRSMAIESNPYGWLTAKRLYAHGTILAVCLWSLYVWTLAIPGLRDRNGNLKGTDFLHFYTLGSLAIEHRGADLYNMNAQAALAAQRVPQAAGIRYLPLYPPHVSLFFAPLALFPYAPALALWWVYSTLIYAICCYTLWRACARLREYGLLTAILAFAFPAFFHLIAWGQTSALALACFTVMFFLLHDQRDFAAGLVLGCLIFKPQLGLAAGVVFVGIGAWKVVAGAALSAVVQLSAGVVYYGIQPLRYWFELLRNARPVMTLLEPKPYQTHCLRTFWSMLVPWAQVSYILYVCSAITVIALTIVCWKKNPPAPLALRYSALLVATVLVAPHLTVYDLIILTPAFLLLADWLLAQASSSSIRRLATLLYLIYALPLIGPLTRWTHVQLSVVAMTAGLVLIAQLSRGAGSAISSQTEMPAPQESGAPTPIRGA